MNNESLHSLYDLTTDACVFTILPLPTQQVSVCSLNSFHIECLNVLSDSSAIVGAKVNTAKPILKDKTPTTTTDKVSDISTRTKDMPSSSVLVIIPV